MTATIEERTVLPPDEHEKRRLGGLADALVDRPEHPARLIGPDGDQIELPESLYHVLRLVASAMAAGKAITVAPHNTLLTTQEAADLLGISRPTLVRLLEAGEIPFQRRGRHRRVLLADLDDYRLRMRVKRRRALRQMTREAEEAGLYEATSMPDCTR